MYVKFCHNRSTSLDRDESFVYSIHYYVSLILVSDVYRLVSNYYVYPVFIQLRLDRIYFSYFSAFRV